MANGAMALGLWAALAGGLAAGPGAAKPAIAWRVHRIDATVRDGAYFAQARDADRPAAPKQAEADWDVAFRLPGRR